MHVPLPTYNQVTKSNLSLMQPMIVQLLKQAAFIALDAEFTGLGSNPQTTRAKDVQERYELLCGLVKTHALIAFGLAIFIRVEGNGSGSGLENERAYQVHNFNFSMLVERDYMVSPKSMLFLAENGLDLNQWILEGIPYTGGDRLTNEGGRGNPNGIMRSIFKRIMTRQVPVVVHNGFLDLVFLYHSFYADLPPKLSTFVADLSDMFAGGLFDTKYISDYITRERSSFLAYLFRKYERDDARMGQENAQQESKEAGEKTETKTGQAVFSTFDIQPRLALPAMGVPAAAAVVATTSSSTTSSRGGRGRNGQANGTSENQSEYCEDYAFHGVCKKNMRCGKSHDLDLILDAEERQRNAKRRKKQKTGAHTSEQSGTEVEAEGAKQDVDMTESEDSANITATIAEDSTIAHSSGILSPLVSESSGTSTTTNTTTATGSKPVSTPVKEVVVPESPTPETKAVVQSEKFHSAYFDAFMTGTVFSHQLNQHLPDQIEEQAKNRIYLIGKSFPLKLEKSAFTKWSPAHERQRS